MSNGQCSDTGVVFTMACEHGWHFRRTIPIGNRLSAMGIGWFFQPSNEDEGVATCRRQVAASASVRGSQWSDSVRRHSELNARDHVREKNATSPRSLILRRSCIKPNRRVQPGGADMSYRHFHSR